MRECRFPSGSVAVGTAIAPRCIQTQGSQVTPLHRAGPVVLGSPGGVVVEHPGGWGALRVGGSYGVDQQRHGCSRLGDEPQRLGVVSPQRPDGATEAMQANPAALAVTVLGVPGDRVYLGVLVVREVAGRADVTVMVCDGNRPGGTVGQRPDLNRLR